MVSKGLLFDTILYQGSTMNKKLLSLLLLIPFSIACTEAEPKPNEESEINNTDFARAMALCEEYHTIREKLLVSENTNYTYNGKKVSSQEQAELEAQHKCSIIAEKLNRSIGMVRALKVYERMAMMAARKNQQSTLVRFSFSTPTFQEAFNDADEETQERIKGQFKTIIEKIEAHKAEMRKKIEEQEAASKKD